MNIYIYTKYTQIYINKKYIYKIENTKGVLPQGREMKTKIISAGNSKAPDLRM